MTAERNGSAVPWAVRVASVLLGASAVLAAAMAVAGLFAWRHFGPASVAYVQALGNNHYLASPQLADVRGGLAYNIAVTAAAALVTGCLAPAVRRPLRWVQVTAWCTAVLFAAGLFCGLSTGPAARTLDEISYGLVPAWYPGLNAVLGVAVLVTIVAAAAALLRSSVDDFYRPASREQDPRWAAFVQRQADRDT